MIELTPCQQMEPPPKRPRLDSETSGDADLESNTIKLDSTGDLILTVEESGGAAKTYLVCSPVLRLASSTLRDGIDRKVQECSALEPRPQLQFVLQSDDQCTADWILRMLHHRTREIPDNPSPRQIALVAIQCTKLGLTEVVLPFMNLWLAKRMPEICVANTEDIGFLYMSAYVCKLKLLTGVVMNAARWLSPSYETTWKAHPVLKDLGESGYGIVRVATNRVQTAIQVEVQSALLQMTQDAACFDMKASSDSAQSQCNAVSRTSEFLATLHGVGLWPITRACQRKSADSIVGAFPSALAHEARCSGDYNCPLSKTLDGLEMRLDRIFAVEVSKESIEQMIKESGQ
ncbi:hypothetical protein LIA77_08374 [Sarocladium implicatum]|nr:hypothetical protein LIA77_08374 [Sarocladium implicatum]